MKADWSTQSLVSLPLWKINPIEKKQCSGKLAIALKIISRHKCELHCTRWRMENEIFDHLFFNYLKLKNEW